MDRLSAREARRMALAAQGFAGPRAASAGTARIRRELDRLKVLQIDSVNVFERSHYLPLFARLGAYDKRRLDRLVLAPDGPYLEYWAHEAAFLPREDLGLFAFRMARYREKYGARLVEQASLVETLRAALEAEGPLAASDIDHEANVRSGPWWGWSDVKRTLETLFAAGEVVTAGRKGFERRYALPEQVPGGLPDPLPEPDAIRELVRRAAEAHGVAALPDLADYHRLRSDETARAAKELEEAGELVPVQVEGWLRAGRPMPAWRHVDAVLPRRVQASAVLSPFDPVVWQRDRLLRLFGFHYRISIYTPAEDRVHGYYVLPVLQGDRLVGRVDLKSDRKAGRLLVQSAWLEDGEAPEPVAERLAPVLASAAAWQGLEGIEVVQRGDLAPALTRVLVPAVA